MVTYALSVYGSDQPIIRGARYQDSAWDTATNVATATSPEALTMGMPTSDGLGQVWLPIMRFSAGALSGSLLRNRRASLLDDFAWATPLALPLAEAGSATASNLRGDLTTALISFASSGTEIDIAGSTLTAGGSTWSTVTPLDTIPIAAADQSPQVAVDGYGNGLVVWGTSDGAFNAVAASRVTVMPSVSWSSPADVSTRTVDALGDLLLDVQADGAGIILWTEDDGNQESLMAAPLR
jgi:hypothetical protein